MAAVTDVPGGAAEALRPPRDAWARSTRPAEPRTTGFGPTVFDLAASPAPARHRASTGSVFDVCHPGVVLRALLFVHTVMAIGVAFSSRGLQSWLELAASSSSVALPAVLTWLLMACALRAPLGALPMALQGSAAVLLGSVSGGAWAVLMGSVMPDALLSDSPPWAAPALCGGALAAGMFYWLQLRAKATLPAETAARLAELQSRIRPHFLFNTLNTALTLVRLDPVRAEVVLEDLAELFRVAITDSGGSVTLESEVELARRYLAIEQIRFGSRLRLTWELDPAASGARMPPLLLQPLVENAVRHGVEPSDEGGAIRVRTHVKNGRAVVTITNSVPPRPSRSGNRIALNNVRERLQLMHDVAAQFDARGTADAFRVQMVVPL